MHKQEKPKPVQRAFHGLVGRPIDFNEAPVGVLEPESAAPSAERAASSSRCSAVTPSLVTLSPAPNSKRGRKRKHASDADRNSSHYLQKTEAERKKLVLNIMWRVRRMVAKPLGPADGYSAKKHAEMTRNNAAWLSSFRDELLTLTIQPLKKFYRVLLGHTDATGRLPGERSGEGLQFGGMSEIERILACIVGGVEDDLTVGEPERETAPVPFAIEDEPRRVKQTLPREPREVERLLEEALVTVADELWPEDADVFHSFPCCTTTCNNVYSLRSHLREQYRAGERTEQALTTYRSAGVDVLMRDAEAALANNLDYARLLSVMKRCWEEEKAAARKERRWNRAAKDAKRQHKEERLIEQEKQSRAEGWGLGEVTKSGGESHKKRDRVETGPG